MKLVCGLGNPGKKYQQTRHNAGFLIVDQAARLINIAFSTRKFDSYFAEGRWEGERIILLKPQTFMNLSGNAVGSAVEFYQLSSEQMLVVHDDADLPAGRMRFKRGGGTAGHKGLNSIRDRLGQADFDRLRYGIGRPDNPAMELTDYVLTEFFTGEEELHRVKIEAAAEAVLAWISQGIAAAMEAYNGLE